MVAVHQGEAHQQTAACQLCNLDFTVLAEYYEHAKSHNGPRKRDLALKEEPKECPHCEKILHSSVAYIKHLDICSKRPDRTEEIFYCDKCTFKTSLKGQLRNHQLRTHEKIRSHKCDLCTKTFFSNFEKDNHRRTHFSERPFVCDLCGSGFKNRMRLNGHKIKVHKKQRKLDKMRVD